MDNNDLKIWKEYSKDISKLKNTNRVTPHAQTFANKTPKKNETKRQTEEVLNIIVNRENWPTLSVSPLNKNERRKFREEAMIDLHGHTREVDETLEIFCAKCILNNIKSIVIVSGKGNGILRNAVRSWLENNPRFIIGYFEIRDSRAESGAFGVRLRGK